MNKKFEFKRIRDNKAITDMIGTLLLLLMAIALFSIIYFFVFSIEPVEQPPSANIFGYVEGDYIIFEHWGGESLRIDTNIRLNIADYPDLNIEISSYLADIQNPDSWDMGEKLIYPPSMGFSGLQVKALVVDPISNSVMMNSILQEGLTSILENTPPTSEDNSIVVAFGTPYIFTLSDFSFDDPDSGQDLYKIKITSLETIGDLLYNGIDVTLDQEIKASDIILGKLTYNPVSLGVTSFDFMVNDSVDYSDDDYTMTITIISNDPPTCADLIVTTNEDVEYIFQASDFEGDYSDPNGDPFQGIKITVLETVGSLKYDGFDVTMGQEISKTDIILSKFNFVPVDDEYGTPYDTFKFQVTDGLSYSIEYLFTINVNSINDLPMAGDNTVATEENTQYVFQSSDFDTFYNDVEADPFMGIKITTLETVGDLIYNGGNVVINQVITAVNIGLLTFDPNSDENGDNYDSFGFQVYDGTDYSIEYTMTIDVTPVNNPPTSADDSISTKKTADFIFTLSNFSFSDVDTGDQLEFVIIESLLPVGFGSLEISGTPVTAGESILRADIISGNLVFDPISSSGGIDSFLFRVHDGTEESSSTYTMTVEKT